MKMIAAALLGPLLGVPALAAPPEHIMVRHGDVQLEAPAQGKGPATILLPSLGRGAADFDDIAKRLGGAGLRLLRPQARAIGQALGDRVTIVVILNSAHAVIVEQPVAVSGALIAYARKP